MPHNLQKEYPNIFGCHVFTEQIFRFTLFIEHGQTNIRKRFGANIQMFSDFQEFINKYPNIFCSPKVYKQISEYICNSEIAQIQI